MSDETRQPEKESNKAEGNGERDKLNRCEKRFDETRIEIWCEILATFINKTVTRGLLVQKRFPDPRSWGKSNELPMDFDFPPFFTLGHS